MAFFTVFPQVVVVRIGVATVAIAERYAGKPLERLAVFRLFFVAFDASDRFVLSQQGEIRFAVVKFPGR